MPWKVMIHVRRGSIEMLMQEYLRAQGKQMSITYVGCLLFSFYKDVMSDFKIPTTPLLA
jgi:hypothetical protein